ncbi:MAG TPA: hydantoinase/oxoprolinase family protein [Candidatus Baltobacteraceae bacterium]|nr:hydantoinase/oxoprolinase family protein [Candidatus Baltobacteraceae bacterium]
MRVGIDIGGTFTDLVAVGSWSGRPITIKVPTTPHEPQRGAMNALRSLLDRYPDPPEIEFLAHSTTIATNALLGQVGLEIARVVLVTTEGFRDVIEIGRQNRSEVYNLFVERPRPLVAREDRLTVVERLDHNGVVIVPLDEASLARACDDLHDRQPEAVAVCLLHAYANDAHEQRVAQAVRARLPNARITVSSQIDPQYREYERFSTTVVNAALAPLVERYLSRLTEELARYGVRAPLYVMRSDGGMAEASHILARPAALIESGPASGAVAAAALAGRAGTRLLSFDMGGTTAKAGTIVDGIPQVAGEFEAAGRTHSGRALKGSGYPVRFPFVDLAEISAGGGTIAWTDAAGALRVGPLSAGADPGPACYGKSDRPTVTDANVVLGRLNPQHLLGGDFPIDAWRSQSAIDTLARKLEASLERAAVGVIRLVDDAMANVLRIVTIERGLDPRDFTLVAFGGGGPLHACAVSHELGVRRIVVPSHPGLFSAFGLLAARLHCNELRPVLRSLREIDDAAVESAFAAMERHAGNALSAQGADRNGIQFKREYDARYRGQSFELPVAYARAVATVESAFALAHRARYGYDVPDEEIEIVNARLTAYGTVAETTGVPESTGAPAHASRVTERSVWTGETFEPVAVLPREALMPGVRRAGPLVVEEYDSTTYVAPGWSVTREDELLLLEAMPR